VLSLNLTVTFLSPGGIRDRCHPRARPPAMALPSSAPAPT